MKRSLAVLALASAIGLEAFALASGQEDPGRRPGQAGGATGGMGGMMGGMMSRDSAAAERPWISLALRNKDELGLTPDQVTRLESLQAEFRKEGIRRSANLEIAETELDELLRAEAPDLSKVEAKLRQLESVRAELRLSRIRTLEQAKALLSPEQRQKLASLGPRAAADSPAAVMTGRGMDEMQRFMSSERMPQAMTGMMEMARQMGDGDPMLGMVRMMEMMSMMGQMGQGGMMGPTQPRPSQ